LFKLPQVHGVGEDVANTGRPQGGEQPLVYQKSSGTKRWKKVVYANLNYANYEEANAKERD